MAQEAKTLRLLNYDQKKIHYGFQIGLFSSNLNVKHSDYFLLDPEVSDSTLSISPNRHGSFSLGFVFNKSLADELWDLRIVPNVSFYLHSINFSYPNTQVTQTIENNATFIELPILVKYASVRRGNQRFYLLGGFTAAYGVGGRKTPETNSRDLLFNRWNFEITYGIGFNGYMQLFNFAPELRFSHGVMNMVNAQDNVFSNNIDRITTHKVGIYLNFEG